MGLLPTGRAVNVRVAEIFRLTGGEITERWGVVDRTALLTQIGAAPAGAQA
jgi:predicted ester cyclase